MSPLGTARFEWACAMRAAWARTTSRAPTLQRPPEALLPPGAGRGDVALRKASSAMPETPTGLVAWAWPYQRAQAAPRSHWQGQQQHTSQCCHFWWFGKILPWLSIKVYIIERQFKHPPLQTKTKTNHKQTKTYDDFFWPRNVSVWVQHKKFAPAVGVVMMPLNRNMRITISGLSPVSARGTIAASRDAMSSCKSRDVRGFGKRVNML